MKKQTLLMTGTGNLLLSVLGLSEYRDETKEQWPGIYIARHKLDKFAGNRNYCIIYKSV